MKNLLVSTLWVLGVLCGEYLFVVPVEAQDIPELTAPVNDFANVIDPSSEQAIDTLIRRLQQASGDVVVVATIETYAPYADIREYAVKMFENGGKGIGQRGRDNGALVLLAVRDRQVWTEVGYDLESFVTDGFAGQTAREVMIPEFRRGNYGAGVLAGVSRIIGRIAQGRNVTLEGVPVRQREAPNTGSGGMLLLMIFIAFMVLNAIAGRTRRRRFGRNWSRWNSGVGPFGGPFGGGFGGFGGGGGGGFGGFGGGRSGGGGGGGGW